MTVTAATAFSKYYTHAERFDGGHQLNEKVLRHTLLPLVRQLMEAAGVSMSR